jgi:GMP synthase (glutamine-hydrolysing)
MPHPIGWIMADRLRFLVAESEPPQARDARRKSVGRSSGETFMDTMAGLVPGAACDRIKPADANGTSRSGAELAEYDAVFLTGSPLHLYEDSPEVRREIDFMRAVFASGTPSFGSCAGLQLATVAAGGTVRPNARGREAGFGRRITPTPAGAAHPLLEGRPASFDAPSVHGDEVEALPDGATLLASNSVTEVQAAEIRLGPGIFWGVQYHPELSLGEVAAALLRQQDDLLEAGLVDTAETLAGHAELIEALGEAPERRDLAWRLGLDREVTDRDRRTTELRNFVAHLVNPTRSARLRA